MKFVKAVALLMSLSIVGMSLCACAAEPEPVSSDINIISIQGQKSSLGLDSTDIAYAESENFVFNYNGYDFIIDTPLDESKLPENFDLVEEAHCAGIGLAHTYVTDSFKVQLRLDSENIIGWIYFKDDLVSTAEGIRIGNTIDEVRQVYGEPDLETSEALMYNKGSSKIQFNFEIKDEVAKVKEIQYFSTIEDHL